MKLGLSVSRTCSSKSDEGRILGMKWQALALITLLCLSSIAQTQGHDARLMSALEYKGVLDKIDAELPKWELSLKSVDPAKTAASYAVGKEIVGYRDIGLMQTGYVRQYVAKEHARHTVSGELALEGFLRGVFDAMESMVATETIAGVTASNVEKYAPEIAPLQARIGNDVTARVELLEKATCP
jgi:hypothetical protein